MLQRYKEVFYGLLFGLGASVIDVFMHASMEQQGFWMELIHPQPIMVAYRVFFIAFGLALGWLLWRKNKVERDFRSLAETVEQFRRHLPPEAQEMIRFAYEKSREIGALAEEKLPSTKGA